MTNLSESLPPPSLEQPNNYRNGAVVVEFLRQSTNLVGLIEAPKPLHEIFSAGITKVMIENEQDALDQSRRASESPVDMTTAVENIVAKRAEGVWNAGPEAFTEEADVFRWIQFMLDDNLAQIARNARFSGVQKSRMARPDTQTIAARSFLENTARVAKSREFTDEVVDFIADVTRPPDDEEWSINTDVQILARSVATRARFFIKDEGLRNYNAGIYSLIEPSFDNPQSVQRHLALQIAERTGSGGTVGALDYSFDEAAGSIQRAQVKREHADYFEVHQTYLDKVEEAAVGGKRKTNDFYKAASHLLLETIRFAASPDGINNKSINLIHAYLEVGVKKSFDTPSASLLRKLDSLIYETLGESYNTDSTPTADTLESRIKIMDRIMNYVRQQAHTSKDQQAITLIDNAASSTLRVVNLAISRLDVPEEKASSATTQNKPSLGRNQRGGRQQRASLFEPGKGIIT